jgi:hypothetical protein
MYAADRWVGCALVALGVGAWLVTLGFPETNTGVQPSSLPRLVAAILVVLGVILAVKAQRAVAAGQTRRVEWLPGARSRIAAALLALVVFVTLLEHAPALGFPLLAPPLMVVLGRVFGGRRWLLLVLVGIAVSEAAYFFFHGWLDLVLPPSAWF